MKTNTYYYEIYQAKIKEEFVFMKWEWAKKHNWSFKSYKQVWNGIEETDDIYILLGNLFIKFNLYHPEKFKGHSISVSDIIRIYPAIKNDKGKYYKIDEVEVKYYYCDTIGWRDITKEIKGEEL